MAVRTRTRERTDTPNWRKHFVHKYQTELVLRANQVLERKGWNKADLAEEIGWSRPRMSQVLSGDKNLTLETISKMEDALDEDILKVPLDKSEEDTYTKLVEVIDEATDNGETLRHLTALRALIKQLGNEKRFREGQSFTEDSYFHDPYGCR